MHKLYPKILKKIGAIFATLCLGGTLSMSAAEIGSYSFDGEVSIGLDNQYNFRGVNFGEKAPWLGLDLNLPLTTNGNLSLNTGVWYINPTEDGNDEFDAYAYLNFPLWDFEISVGGIYFAFPEADAVSGEFGASIGYTLMDAVDLSLAWWSDVKGNDDGDNKLNLGHYIELAAGKSFQLTEWLDLELGAGISYGIDYFGVDSFNHAFGTIGFPIALTETTTINPYIGGTLALEDLEDNGENDHFLAGISLSTSF